MRQCPFCKQNFDYISRGHLNKCAKDNNVNDYKEAWKRKLKLKK